MFHCNRVPGHVNALNGAEGCKGLADGVLAQLVVDGANVDAAHDGQGPLPLCCHLPAGGARETRGRMLLHRGEPSRGKNHYTKTHM